MKNSLHKLPVLIFLSALIIFSVSCKKEDEEEKASNDLHGTWTFKETNVDLSVGGVDLVDYLVNTMGYSATEAQFMVDFYVNAMESSNQGTITFNDDNTYKYVDGQGEENGTWSITNDGNTLTMVYDGETDNLTILSLSSSSLKLRLPPETESVDMDGDDVEETDITVVMEISLTK
jgi:hypothetical protein